VIDPRLLERKRYLFDASMHENAGRHDEAADWYRKALEAGEPDPRILHLLAVACRRAGSLDEAEEALAAARLIAGDTPTLIAESAELAASRGLSDKALELMQRAASGDSPDPQYLLRCAELALEDGNAPAAVSWAQRASRAGARANRVMASACLQLADLPAAASAAEAAFREEPDRPVIAGLLAAVRVRQGRVEEAVSIATQSGGDALELLADTLKDCGRIDEALPFYDSAMANRPDDPDIAFNRATALLAAGRLTEGFEAYECRWQRQGKTWRPVSAPRWQGEQLAGKHLLVWTEQGLGEEILHLRALGRAVEQAFRITVETTDRLVPLIARAFPGITIVPRQDPPHPALTDESIDLHCPAADLLRHFPDAGSDPPGLAADADRVGTLAARYRQRGSSLLAGICWSTERTPAAASKSVPTALLAPIMRLPGIDWVSLQFGESGLAEAQRLETSTGTHLVRDPDIDALSDLDGAAAQIAALDIVISISTTNAHLAAALGKDVRVMLNTRPLWHWGHEGESCRWYPTARLYRQVEPGDWATPLAVLRRDLEELSPG
jgi:tetratricopeptide (TPR) repeat protein